MDTNQTPAKFDSELESRLGKNLSELHPFVKTQFLHITTLLMSISIAEIIDISPEAAYRLQQLQYEFDVAHNLEPQEPAAPATVTVSSVRVEAAQTVFERWICEDLGLDISSKESETFIKKMLEAARTAEQNRLQSLLDRIRPGSEAAPWVVEELKNIVKATS